ncbi:hypothetical protein D3C75_915010 [compost metagenome]
MLACRVIVQHGHKKLGHIGSSGKHTAGRLVNRYNYRLLGLLKGAVVGSSDRFLDFIGEDEITVVHAERRKQVLHHILFKRKTGYLFNNISLQIIAVVIVVEHFARLCDDGRYGFLDKVS